MALNGITWDWVTKVFKAHLMEDANRKLFVTLDQKTYNTAVAASPHALPNYTPALVLFWFLGIIRV